MAKRALPEPEPHRPPKKRSPGLRPLYLDILPAELCVRIAMHLSRGQQTPSLLALSRVSPMQHAAATTALANTYTFLADRDAHAWASLLHPSLQVANFSASGLVSHDPLRDPLQTLRAPRLLSATIPSDNAVFTALTDHARLTTLVVHTTRLRGVGDASATLCDILALATTLPALTSLTLVCRAPYCLFRTLLAPHDSPRHISLFSSACAGLTSIRIDCPHTHPTLELLPYLPKLETITLDAKIEDADLAAVRAIPDVRISYSPKPVHLARELSPVLTVLETGDVFDAAAMHVLARCTRLTRLALRVHPGTEKALGDAVAQMSDLTSLSLAWGREPDDESITCAWFPRLRYYAPPPNAVLFVVNAAKNVTELALNEVQICGSELEAILSAVGGGLQRLRVCCGGQGEEPLQRMERVLLACVRCCSGLKRVAVNEFSPVRKQDCEGVRKRRKELLLTLRRLKRVAPLLDDEPLHAFLDRFLWDTDCSAAASGPYDQ